MKITLSQITQAASFNAYANAVSLSKTFDTSRKCFLHKQGCILIPSLSASPVLASREPVTPVRQKKPLGIHLAFECPKASGHNCAAAATLRNCETIFNWRALYAIKATCQKNDALRQTRRISERLRFAVGERAFQMMTIVQGRQPKSSIRQTFHHAHRTIVKTPSPKIFQVHMQHL